MFGAIARYVSLRLAASLIVAAALPVSLVAAAAVANHPAAPGHASFTTPNHAVGTTGQPSVAQPTETPDANAADQGTTNQDGANARPTDNHGYAVSRIAQNPQATGGPNGNHGGAVSQVARGDHDPCGTNPPGKSGGHCPFPTPTPTP